VLAAVVRQVLPAITRRQPVVAWIVDNTGIPKKGKHSVDLARQYCGQLGKQDNCQVAVTLSLATWETSLPVAYRLYLPREWVEDRALRRVAWRQGSNRRLGSRFVAVRVRPAHRDYGRAEPHEELWLLAEWPRGAAEPTKYWLANLPPETTLEELVRLAKHRWIVERDYLELKQELGLGHFEGRSWRGFHHHATLCIAAYGFLVAERSRFSPSARAGRLELAAAELPADYRPRGGTRAGAEA